MKRENFFLEPGGNPSSATRGPFGLGIMSGYPALLQRTKAVRLSASAMPTRKRYRP